MSMSKSSAASLLPVTEDYQVQLEIFEGPLDLLLYLIRTQELDIYDIPISQITDQYLEYLRMMEELNIAVAGEFLVISSTLILIKSEMLLPTEEIDDEEELVDPRQELVERLIEHERFKNASQVLYAKETVELSVWGKGDDEFAEEEKELISATTFDLIHAFHNMVERFKEQIVIEMQPEKVTLKDKLKEIRKLLSAQGQFYFSSFFDEKISKRHLVVTFIALLELVRLSEVRLFQKGVYEDIRIVSC